MAAGAKSPRRWWAVAASAVAVLVLVALLWPRDLEDTPAPPDAPVTQAPAPASTPARAPAPASQSAVTAGTPAEPAPPASEPPSPGTTPAVPPEAPPIELPPTTQR